MVHSPGKQAKKPPKKTQEEEKKAPTLRSPTLAPALCRASRPPSTGPSDIETRSVEPETKTLDHEYIHTYVYVVFFAGTTRGVFCHDPRFSLSQNGVPEKRPKQNKRRGGNGRTGGRGRTATAKKARGRGTVSGYCSSTSGVGTPPPCRAQHAF